MASDVFALTDNVALYKCLGVERGATAREIKQAFRKLAAVYHPDKNPDGEARFKEISFAHKVLTDPEQRCLYDAMRLRQPGGRPRAPDPDEHVTPEALKSFISSLKAEESAQAERRRQFEARRRDEYARRSRFDSENPGFAMPDLPSVNSVRTKYGGSVLQLSTTAELRASVERRIASHADALAKFCCGLGPPSAAAPAAAPSSAPHAVQPPLSPRRGGAARARCAPAPAPAPAHTPAPAPVHAPVPAHAAVHAAAGAGATTMATDRCLPPRCPPLWAPLQGRPSDRPPPPPPAPQRVSPAPPSASLLSAASSAASSSGVRHAPEAAGGEGDSLDAFRRQSDAAAEKPGSRCGRPPLPSPAFQQQQRRPPSVPGPPDSFGAPTPKSGTQQQQPPQQQLTHPAPAPQPAVHAPAAPPPPQRPRQGSRFWHEQRRDTSADSILLDALQGYRRAPRVISLHP